MRIHIDIFGNKLQTPSQKYIHTKLPNLLLTLQALRILRNNCALEFRLHLVCMLFL